MNERVERIYKCDYCSKFTRTKRAMINHEKKCKNNPNNHHSCFWCKYLGVYEPDEMYNGYEFECLNEKCKFYGKPLYSYKLDDHPARIKAEGLTRMPLNCSHFKSKLTE